MKNEVMILLLLITGTLVLGCHTPVGPALVKDSAFPKQQVKDRFSLAEPPGGAMLRAGLVINVSVLVAGKNEIAVTAKRISDKGTIAMPLLGTVQVRDQSLEIFSSLLASAYKEFYINPQVVVEFVRDDNKEGLSPWGNVAVLGRVKKPGRISLPATRDLTLSGAIQQAGGYDTSARENAIRVTRKCADGSIRTRKINLRSVGAEGVIENDILLEPQDVVFIPELIF